MPHDYSSAPPPRDLDLIPHGTVATVVIHIRPGGAGEDGLLKRSKNGDCEMLDIEYVVIDGPYARRKFWENQIIIGTTSGQKDMGETYTRHAQGDPAIRSRHQGSRSEPASPYRAILCELAAACDMDWSKPLTAWSRETMAEFLITAMRLIRKAMIARDISGKASPVNRAPARSPPRNQRRGRRSIDDAGRIR